jgi:hypothetical protein
MSNETEDQLCERWEKWCIAQGLEPMSADEFSCRYYDILTQEQRQYVGNFIQTWDEVMYPDRDN